MCNSNKHTCISKEESDMISDLPDEMLQHVLYFLGTKEAVQTSLLSKRWANLWTYLPCLNFNTHEFGAVDEHQLSISEEERLGAKFKGFVETVLYRHEASFLNTFLVKFSKILDKDRCSDLVSRCVSYAMKNNARFFYMEASIPSEQLIACLFTCKSIEEMCLRTSFWHPYYIPEVIPEVVNLPHMRRLQLKKSKLDSRSISRLFLGCPKLEELSLEKCSGDFSCIFSQNLKYLSLRDCALKLPVPNKATMYITSSLPGDTVELKITICSFWVQFILKTPRAFALNNPSSFMQNFINHLDLNDKLRCLSGVSMLKLHGQNSKRLDMELQKLGEFHYLMELCLSGWCTTCKFKPVALFLKKSPHLQKLTLYNCRCSGQWTWNKEGIHQIVDNYMLLEFSRCKNLKVVHIKLSEDHIRAHKVEEASLPYRKKFKNIEIIISLLDSTSFWF